MNILPKKRWHVRTKDNIARVRRDEAKAKEEEQKKQAQLDLAESEARINFLRKKAGAFRNDSDIPNKSSKNNVSPSEDHINLFADYKSHIKTTNKELEKEKKEEQEKYEKQIGYLTYLGQDTNEALKQRSWYEVAPERGIVGDANVVEKDLKTKYAQDPLTLINALLPPTQPPTVKKVNQISSDNATVSSSLIKINSMSPDKGHKTKKSKKHKKKGKKSHRHKKSSMALRLEQEEQKKHLLEKLRRERLRREETERARQEALFGPKETDKTKPKPASTPRIVQKYNSQFNPELAKQNML